MAEEYGFEYEYVPTTTQQKVISVLGIPTALLSVAGSSLIIHHVLQNSKKTPYRRILLGMSGCDIISTFGYVMQPFMSPTGYFNSYVWAFGNQGTCSALGAIIQFAFASHMYSAFLAFYFVCTIRFGVREDKFSKKYERWIHGFILTWSIGTTIAGLVLDIFRANVLGPGCWINSFPDPCLPEEGCQVELIAWVAGMSRQNCAKFCRQVVTHSLPLLSGGLPTLVCFVCIIVCNLILYCFVRRTVREGEKRALQNESRLASYNHQSSRSVSVDSLDMSAANATTNSGGGTSRRSILRSSDKQWQRVREVGKQSFLYVSAFLFCYIWSFFKQGLDGQNFDEIEGSGAYFLPLLILQALCLPAQGFFNACIYFRPKYIQAKRRYPDQTTSWYLRRSVMGEKLKPVRNFNAHANNTLMSNTAGDTMGDRRSKRITFAGELVSIASTHSPPIPGTLKIPQDENLRASPSILEPGVSMLESTLEVPLSTSEEVEHPTDSTSEEVEPLTDPVLDTW